MAVPSRPLTVSARSGQHAPPLPLGRRPDEREPPDVFL